MPGQKETAHMKRSTLAGALFGILALSCMGSAQAQLSVSIGLHLPGLDLQVGAPPPPWRGEAVPPPRHGYLWRPGFWRWDRGDYVWVPGIWLRARAGYVWYPDRWEQRGGDWYFTEGYWRAQHDWREAQRREDRRWREWAETDRHRPMPAPARAPNAEPSRPGPHAAGPTHRESSPARARAPGHTPDRGWDDKRRNPHSGSEEGRHGR